MTFKANLMILIPFTPVILYYNSSEMKNFLFILFCGMFLYAILTIGSNIQWPTKLQHIHIRTWFTKDELKKSESVRQLQSCHVPPEGSDFSIRICQITDPHLGDFCSTERLRKFCELICDENPDFVFLTGDFYTPAGSVPGGLEKSLEPLKKISKKCYACYGNHDIESVEITKMCRDELEAIGVKVLVNEHEEVKLPDIDPQCSLQIVGINWDWSSYKQRERKKKEFLNGIPSSADLYRLILMHRPSDFKFLDSNIPSTTFAGHTHGGMIFWAKCIANTARLMASGLWQKRHNLLYVNRGQGSRSLGLNLLSRMNVSLEYSVYHLHFQRKNANKIELGMQV